MSDELATEDLLGFEIVKAGGPYRGVKSPPGGEFITGEDLDAAVLAAEELQGEIHRPVKLGHNLDQKALVHDGLLSGDGVPAAGWVENLRRAGDSLVVDLKKVPRLVAQMMRAGAYRGRSIEFYRNYTDASGKTHPFVICGLALLGAQQPAVKGLKDWAQLYASDLNAEVLEAFGEEPGQGAGALVLSGPGAFAEEPSPQASEADASTAEGAPAPEVLDRTPTGDGSTPAVAFSAEFGEAAATTPTPQASQEGQHMAKFSPALLERLGLSEGADESAIEEAVQAALNSAEETAAAASAAPSTDPKTSGELAELRAQVGVLSEQVQDGQEARRLLAEAKRTSAVDEAIAGFKIAPADREKWLGWYADAPDMVQAQIDALPARTDLREEIGHDGMDANGKELLSEGVETFTEDEDSMFKQLNALPGGVA